MTKQQLQNKIRHFVDMFGAEWLNDRAEILAEQTSKYGTSRYAANVQLIETLRYEQEFGWNYLNSKNNQ